MVARAQLENSYRLTGNQLGSSISSGGRTGTPLQRYCPNSDSQILVNTRASTTPPLERMNSLGAAMRGSSAPTPASFRAK